MTQTESLPLWTSTELTLALNTQVDSGVQAFGVVINTQELKPGDIFIALTTGKTDGHLYVKQAIEKGAAACIVNKKQEDVPMAKQIIVPDTLQALHALARFARMRTEAIVIGVTGSCGKTTTKEMLKECFSAQGRTHATEKNLNNNLGVPLTLARMPTLTQYAVIEMGISHPEEMVELSDLVRPNISVITNIAPAHQEFFANEQEIARAKADIFEFQDKNGTAILNKDSPFYHFFADLAVGKNIKKIISFGETVSADFHLVDAIPMKSEMQVNADWHGEKLHYALHYMGKHFALDSLACLAAIDAAGASVELAIDTLKKIFPLEGRGLIEKILVDGKHINMINDAYNANPASMKASLIGLGLHAGRKVAVLGDMLELGENSGKMHLDLLPTLAQNGVDVVCATGPMMKQVVEALPENIKGLWVAKTEELIPVLKEQLQTGDTVLFKASNSIGLTEVIKAIKGVKGE